MMKSDLDLNCWWLFLQWYLSTASNRTYPILQLWFTPTLPLFHDSVTTRLYLFFNSSPSVMLYHKAGMVNKALELAFKRRSNTTNNIQLSREQFAFERFSKQWQSIAFVLFLSHHITVFSVFHHICNCVKLKDF